MDSQVVNELAGVLEQESRVYESMLTLSKNKSGIIVKGKVTELENIVKLEQSLILQMGRLENLREELVEKLAQQFELKPGDITITELAKRLSMDQARNLKQSQDKLVGTINELKNSNDLNSKLIKNSLEYIDFSINLYANANTGDNNYGKTGQVNDPKKRSFFDMKL